MRVFYAIYAIAVIGLLCIQRAESLPWRLALWADIALSIAGLIMVTLKMRWSSWVGLAAIVPFLAMSLLHNVLYIEFVVEHRGLDCATCNGSPVVLIMSWTLELIFFIPGIVLLLWLARTPRQR